MYNRAYKRSNKVKFDQGITSLVAVVLILITLFMIRFVNIAIKKNVRGNLAYIELLNFGMPVIKETHFDKGAYLESPVNLWSLVLEASNLNGINPVGLISYEIPYFKDNKLAPSYYKNSVVFDPFKLNNDSVTKLNPEELNKDDTKAVSKVAYNPKLKKTLNSAKPEVLIYHSHTTEAYLPAKADSTDNNLNVVAVGDELEHDLEENYGISVIHDKTIHSLASYDESYNRSRETVSKYLKKYGDFKLIIDLHRDSVGGAGRNAFATELNNEQVAKIMFVTTNNNPHHNVNDGLVDFFNKTSRELFPGFCKGVHTYNRGIGMFNQDLSNNSVLIEVGAEQNTATEAKASAKYISRIIAEKLNGKK
ncbi:stage II sporulation protein P [Clostridium cavendishii DSM 21758]|uniref:Stage II sporulation protein P n=1 Tax=Clostridium cavendishii DSM 21758 TaxID=1121302 RepID=A0A1M6AQ05_9CLOT|nr:stage II sporulation protein P [Clostridium cavendishii]SHI38293.1 stage II sporulation protein P [Clostridium cavendishii DSM 21758]